MNFTAEMTSLIIEIVPLILVVFGMLGGWPYPYMVFSILDNLYACDRIYATCLANVYVDIG